MQASIKISDPSTVYIKFTGTLPAIFVLTDDYDNVEYFRYLDGHTPRIKFNVPESGNYLGNTDFEIVKIVPIEIPGILPTLPPAERDRWTANPVIIYDENWTESPASNFTFDGVIMHGPAYAAMIKPIRIFIDLHEKGHYFYCTEEYCDLYALVNFLRMGYNRSTAYYALSKVLNRTSQGIARIDFLMKNIIQTTGEFSPQ